MLIDNRFEPLPGLPGTLSNGPVSAVLDRSELCYKLLPRLLECTHSLAEERATQIVAAALLVMHGETACEADRLRDLRAVNPSVRQAEIDAAQQHFYDLRDALAAAQVRLDAVRLIFRPSRLNNLYNTPYKPRPDRFSNDA